MKLAQTLSDVRPTRNARKEVRSGINRPAAGISSLGRALITDSAVIEGLGRPKMLRAWSANRPVVVDKILFETTRTYERDS